MYRSLRAALVSGVVVSALPLAMPASAQVAPSEGAAPQRYDATIRYLNFHHVRAVGASVTISGQVVATVDGTKGAVGGASVRLYRRVGGTATWEYVGTTATSRTSTPEFQFVVTTRATAQYEVRFAGTTTYSPAEATTRIAVHRTINGHIEDRSGHLHGRVAPRYAHRWVHLEKRSCAGCGWKLVRMQRTGDHGHYRFIVGAPRTGRSYWRVTTPATHQFIRSSSAVFSTRLV
jgi:hypothetical protein